MTPEKRSRTARGRTPDSVTWSNPEGYSTSMDAFVSLRRLTSADAALLRALNELFGETFGDSETYCLAPPSDAYLSELLAREHVIAL